MNNDTKKLTTVGMLCALAVIVNLLIHFPMIPAVSFLSYDPKDIIIVIGGFIYGPLTAFVMSLITSFLEIFYRGGTLLDVLMNVISTCTFACVASATYKRDHTRNGALLGLAAGTLCCVLSMLLWNYIITPIYFGMPRAAVAAILLPGDECRGDPVSLQTARHAVSPKRSGGTKPWRWDVGHGNDGSDRRISLPFGHLLSLRLSGPHLTGGISYDDDI